MTEKTHEDWERIKKVIDAYGMRKGFKKGEFLLNFIKELDEYHDCNEEKGIVFFINLYTDLISTILKTYPNIPLKKLLDEDGTYSNLKNDKIEHMLNEELILKDWRNTLL